MKVIGAIGLIGSGKDTVIEYISEKCGVPMVSIGELVRARDARTITLP